MTIRKRSNGKYQIREMRHGVTKCLTIGHKPTQREAKLLIDEQFTTESISPVDTFENCAKQYIEIKRNVLSPSTIRGYFGILKGLSDEIKQKDVSVISNLDVQKEINRLAVDHAPKTVRNFHAFITSVLAVYCPDTIIKTTLPQRVKEDVYIPTDEEVKAILSWVKENRPNCYLAFRLACYGLRRSEILAITPSDVKGNMLSVNKALVNNENNVWVTKATKTTESKREIMIDDALAKALKKSVPYTGYPNSLLKVLILAQDSLGIKRFQFHKLRHYFVSKCIDAGIDIVTIRAWVGHSSNTMINQVYAHKMNTDDNAKKMIDIFKSDIL